MSQKISHRSLLLAMQDQEFNQWRHNPITAAYLQFLDDQRANLREAGLDILEMGRDLPSDWRGRVLTLSELYELKLETIQEFYRTEENAGKTD